MRPRPAPCPATAAGSSPRPRNSRSPACTFTGNATGGGGGAFYSFDYDASVVTDCHFAQNTAQWGGAAYLERSRATLTRCEFVDGTAVSGGAIELSLDAIVAFTECGFTGNAATSADGGAIQAWGSALALTRCRFAGNTTGADGGAVKLGGTNALITDSVFHDNHARRGGAVYSHWCAPRLTGCTLAGNSAVEQGGGVYASGGSPLALEHCIIAFSPAGEALAGGPSATFLLSCCNIFGNAGGDWTAPIADQLGGAGNFSADPLFCDLAGGDLALQSASPCAEANSPYCGQIGALPVACRITGVPEASGVGAVVMAPAVPNPFNPATTIGFALAAPGPTRVTIVDLAGRVVRTLRHESLPAGGHSVVWDGRDDGGRPAAAGVYHGVVVSGGAAASTRLALVR